MQEAVGVFREAFLFFPQDILPTAAGRGGTATSLLSRHHQKLPPRALFQENGKEEGDQECHFTEHNRPLQVLEEPQIT